MYEFLINSTARVMHLAHQCASYPVVNQRLTPSLIAVAVRTFSVASFFGFGFVFGRSLEMTFRIALMPRISWTNPGVRDREPFLTRDVGVIREKATEPLGKRPVVTELLTSRTLPAIVAFRLYKHIAIRASSAKPVSVNSATLYNCNEEAANRSRN